LGFGKERGGAGRADRVRAAGRSGLADGAASPEPWEKKGVPARPCGKRNAKRVSGTFLSLAREPDAEALLLGQLWETLFLFLYTTVMLRHYLFHHRHARKTQVCLGCVATKKLSFFLSE